MSQKKVEPTWPLLSILVCLFVLSATSPSLWERAVRNRASNPPPTASSVALATPQQTIAFVAGGTDHLDQPPEAPLPNEEYLEERSLEEQAFRLVSGVGGTALPAPSERSESDRDVAQAGIESDDLATETLVPHGDDPLDGDKTPSDLRTAEGAGAHGNTDAKAPLKSPSGEKKRWPEDVEELRALVLPTEPLGDRPTPRRDDAKVAHQATEGKTEGKTAEKPLQTGAKAVTVAKEPAVESGEASPTPKLEAAGTNTSAQAKVTDSAKPIGEDPSCQKAPGSTAAKPSTARNPARPPADSLWPAPEALLAQLAELAKEPETRQWASDVEAVLRKLGPALSEGTPEALPLAARLEQMGQQGGRLAGELGDRPVAARLRRAVYALDRRLALWKPIALAGGLKSDGTEQYDADLRPLGDTLDEVDGLLNDSPEGPGWRRFLELDALRKLVSERPAASGGQARLLARRILDRLVHVPLKEPQRRFLQQGPLAALHRDLRRVAAEPVFFKDLVRCVETYEQDAAPHDGRRLAELCQRLAHSKAASKQAVAQGLEGYYRNANVRLVVAVELLNRFLPERPKEYNDVDDVVLGRPVRGSSLTATRVNLRLIPDPQQIHLALDVHGVVVASTQSVSGPATFYNDSQSVYQGWKEIEIGPEGMRIHPAQVAVNNESTLRGLSTDFDELPLIGALAQEVARSQHEQKRCEISSQVERKIAARAQWQIDQETEARLGTAAEQVRSAVLEPLAELSLGPTLVSAETTERRIAMRLRVASDRQLGSHTPRPQAPADSAVSFQIHESAINNLFEQVGLNGATLTLPQLRARIANRLKCADLLRVDTENDDVTIAFAPRDAVRVACRDGQLILTLAVARLAKPPHAWEDFQVRVFLRPRVQGRTVELLREDVIHLVGSRLNMRSQIALRGVFGKTFSKDRPLAIVPDQIVNEPRLQDLVFTQWVVEDGWIGAALGPGRVARQQSPPEKDAARTH